MGGTRRAGTQTFSLLESLIRLGDQSTGSSYVCNSLPQFCSTNQDFQQTIVRLQGFADG